MEKQIEVAKSMERTAKTWKPEFIYGIGDNFYFWGVENVYDVMWTKTFENVYQRPGSIYGKFERFISNVYSHAVVEDS